MIMHENRRVARLEQEAATAEPETVADWTHSNEPDTKLVRYNVLGQTFYRVECEEEQTASAWLDIETAQELQRLTFKLEQVERPVDMESEDD